MSEGTSSNKCCRCGDKDARYQLRVNEIFVSPRLVHICRSCFQDMRELSAVAAADNPKAPENNGLGIYTRHPQWHMTKDRGIRLCFCDADKAEVTRMPEAPDAAVALLKGAATAGGPK